MNRRDALKNASIILGFTVSAGTAAAVLKGCSIDSSPDWKADYLSDDQIKLVDELSEIIIPKTDTPGAREVQAVRFIDAVLACDKEEDRVKFLTGLNQFDERATHRFEKTFLKCNLKQQKDILDQMVSESAEEGYAGYNIFKNLRERVVVAYCRSEAGATQFLKYDPIPGGNYEGCIDYSTVGGTWAL